VCGIAGYVGTEALAGDDQLLRRLTDGIAHRGPDDEGHFTAPGVGLGMRRLSIVDLTGSRQPIANEDGSVQVVFNGEIYNYLELRDWLRSRGHTLRTKGDTEVLAHLYEELGMDMLGRLRGMFAFALWDARQEKLVLARDRLGKKPLIYTRVGNGLRFCSEIFPLATLPDTSSDMDPAALLRYLTLGYIPAPFTIYRDVRKLPAGSYLVWQKGECRIEKYWTLRFERNDVRDREAAREQFCELLDESIRIRLRSDVPVGLLLSGGLDSNAILARMARGLKQSVKTFTVGFSERRYDESELARQSAEYFGVEHHVLKGQPDLLDLLPMVVRHYGEPYADKSALPSLMLCELTREEVKVALNGDGGDEALAGYSKYRRAWKSSWASSLPEGLREVWTLASLSGRGIGGGKLARNLRRRLLPETESLFTSEFFAGRPLASLLTPELDGCLEQEATAMIDGFWAGPAEPVNRMLSWDYAHYLADDLLVKMDIASMANGLEVRSPFLDHELVEFCAGLPPEWKVDARAGKKLLREVVAADLPPDLMAAPKRGFSVPLEHWWRREARTEIREGLLDLHPDLRDYLNGSAVAALLEEHQSGRRNHAQRLWCLWVLNAWATATR